MKIEFIVLNVLLVFSSCAQSGAQQGYGLDFKITNLKDTSVYLGYYYGESTYIRDTSQVDGAGNFYFEGNEALPHGIYFLVLGKTRLFDMAISDDQHFSMETTGEDYIANMNVKGSEDNRLFYENMLFNAARHKDARPFLDIMQDSLLSEKKKQTARDALLEIDARVMQHQDDIIKQYPTTMTARWLKALKPITPPDSLTKQGKNTSLVYQYYRAHFFDNFDLADDGLIRLPQSIYVEKLKEYLDNMIAPNPDSLISALKKLINKAKRNQETYKYLVWNALIHYQAPKYMGLDRVYVRLYDDYFASGEMDFWVGESTKKNVKEFADRLRLSMIGNKAPNLIMQGSDDNLKSMYDLKNKYVVIFFFDPDCGHCKTETPKLVDFYNENKKRFDLEVYAVSTDTSMQKMRDYINEMKMPWITVNGPRTAVGPYNKLYDVVSTPVIYVINDKKEIIAKKPPIEMLSDFLENYEKIQQEKKNAES